MKTKRSLPRKGAAVLAALLLSSTAYAQFYTSVGLNATGFQTRHQSFEINNQLTTGFNAALGYYMVYPSKDWLRIQPELGYSTHHFSRGLGPDEYDYRFRNFNLPLIVGTRVHPIIWLETGLAVQFIQLRLFENNNRVNRTRTFSSTDTHIILGAQFSVSENISLGLRYRHGLRGWVNYREIGPFGELGPEASDLYIRYAEFSITYKLF